MNEWEYIVADFWGCGAEGICGAGRGGLRAEMGGWGFMGGWIKGLFV